MTVRLQIFDVEHGACALLTTENGRRLMIDCGHNGSTGWRPGTYLRNQRIPVLDMLAVTNYDEDHVSGANDLYDNVGVEWLSRNPSVSSRVIRHLKSDTGIGPGIERLFREIDSTYSGGSPACSPPYFEGVERQMFWNRYPDFDDENNLSMAVFLGCHGVGVLFTGDLEAAGFEPLLERPEFRAALQATNVYIAPHHGRESGCCDRVRRLLTNVSYVVISDKGYMYDTQETLPFYRSIARGGPFRGETRHVLTTRRDGRIGFVFGRDSWGPY